MASGSASAFYNVAKYRLDLCPRVEELVEPRREALRKLRDFLTDSDGRPLQCPNLTLDDTSMVRFLLSHDDDVEAAAASLRRTVRWRAGKAGLLAAVARGVDVPEEDTMRKHASVYTYVASTGAVLLVVRAGRSDPASLASAVSRDVLLDYMLALRERAFLACDTLTRGTGRLIRAVIAMDLDGASLWKMSQRFIDIAGQSTALSDDYYPHLVERIVLLNPPSFLSMILSVARRFLSKRTQALFGECAAASETKRPGAVSTCTFMSCRFLPDDVPDYLSGRRSDTPAETPLADAQAALAALRAAEVPHASQSPPAVAAEKSVDYERGDSSVEG